MPWPRPGAVLRESLLAIGGELRVRCLGVLESFWRVVDGEHCRKRLYF